jgi:hypothetical protein
LDTENRLLLIEEVYRIVECTASCIIREFYKAVRKHQLRVLAQFPSESQFKVLASQFEDLHGIPYIVGAIDGLHIPILAPMIEGEDCYCRKLFHSTILQEIVDVNCKFWNFEFGWTSWSSQLVFFSSDKSKEGIYGRKIHDI